MKQFNTVVANQNNFHKAILVVIFFSCLVCASSVSAQTSQTSAAVIDKPQSKAETLQHNLNAGANANRISATNADTGPDMQMLHAGQEASGGVSNAAKSAKSQPANKIDNNKRYTK